MNPFLSHTILRNLSYELMRNPEREKILQFVGKHRRRRMGLAAAVILFGGILTVVNLNLFSVELGPVLNLISSILILMFGILAMNEFRKIRMTSEELDEVLLKFETLSVSPE